MPFGKWTDFENCVRDFISQGKDEETAERICGYLQAKLGEESFSWVGNVKPHDKNLIQGTALHPIKTAHPQEWPSVRVYLEEELEKAAHTLIGTPLLLNHLYPIDGRVLSAEYEDGAIEYVAELNDEHILNCIRDGKIKHCSVEYDWRRLDKVNGLAPRGIQFVGLALLKDFEPGDPASSVEIWNGIVEKIKETRCLAPPDLKKSSRMVKHLNRIFKERVWDRAYIDDLPDSAFAYVEPGGERDEQGKTVPRSLRHLPLKNAQGKVDVPHLRNALARLPQTSISDDAKAAAKRKLCTAAKAVGIQSGVCGTEEYLKQQEEAISFDVEPEPTVDELIQAIEDIVEQINLRLDDLESRLTRQEQISPENINVPNKEKTKLAKKDGEAVIEPQREEDFRQTVLRELKAVVFERVPQHWGYGAYEQNRRMKELIKKLER